MAAKAWGQPNQSSGTSPNGDEIVLRNDSVSLRMFLNRRARTMRVVDFRAGPSRAKRDAVLQLAQREGIEKIFTLVERDEISTWVKMGFRREASVPGFYKRTDAFLIGLSMKEHAARASHTRISVHNPSQSIRQHDPLDDVASDDDEEDDDAALQVEDPAILRAEKTLIVAKKYSKQLQARSLPSMKITPIDAATARKAVQAAQRGGRALTGFESFGRDAVREYFVGSSKGAADVVLSLEEQPCFQCVFFELLSSPKAEQDWMATSAMVNEVCDKLTEQGYVATFAISPTDDPWMASAFVYAGFRRTGILRDHIPVGDGRRDGYVWSRKLAIPADDA